MTLDMVSVLIVHHNLLPTITWRTASHTFFSDVDFGITIIHTAHQKFNYDISGQYTITSSFLRTG